MASSAFGLGRRCYSFSAVLSRLWYSHICAEKGH